MVARPACEPPAGLEGCSLECVGLRLAAALDTIVDPPSVPDDPSQDPVVDYDSTASFQVVMGEALQWRLSVPRTQPAEARLLSTITGTSGLQGWAGAYAIEDKAGGTHQFSKFVFGNEEYDPSGGVEPLYFDTQSEAFEAAFAKAGSRRDRSVSIFNLEERFEEYVERQGYKTDYVVPIDSSLPGLFLRKRGGGNPKIRVKVQPSSDRSKGTGKTYDKQFNFSGPRTIDLLPDAPPMPYDLPCGADELVLSTSHTMTVSEYISLPESDQSKYQMRRSSGLDYAPRPVPLDPLESSWVMTDRKGQSGHTIWSCRTGPSGAEPCASSGKTASSITERPTQPWPMKLQRSGVRQSRARYLLYRSSWTRVTSGRHSMAPCAPSSCTPSSTPPTLSTARWPNAPTSTSTSTTTVRRVCRSRLTMTSPS